MRYLSTRGGSPLKSFQEIILEGLALDGGLYLPEAYPSLNIEKTNNFLEVAEQVMAPFASGVDLGLLLKNAWQTFPKEDPAPLKKLEDDLYLLELFNGPTLSFKDFGLQFLGAFFEKHTTQPINIIGATSGDTGAAAVHALKGKKGVRLFMLHPRGKISELQRRQMTTVQAPNIFNLAVEGNFDDCQALLKGALASGKFTTVNSINWGRILAQTSYYWWASLKLDQGNGVHFIVPTGNFGNAFSGYVAMRSGAPISGITIAGNQNLTLSSAFILRLFCPGEAIATYSPAMDIQNPSNFERLVFEEAGCDGKMVSNLMSDMRTKGSYTIPKNTMEKMKTFFSAVPVEEFSTLAAITTAKESYDVLIDPHSAVGFSAWRQTKGKIKTPTVLVATAHPAKFPDALQNAIGETAPLPAALTSLMEAPETCHTIRPNAGDLEKFIEVHIHDS